MLPGESTARLCTQWNSPALRPLRPKAPTISPVSRLSVRTSLLAPSALSEPGFLLVGEKLQVPNRAVGACVFFDDEFLHESAVFTEHLDAVVDAIADIDEPVARELHAVNRIAELRRRRR